MVQFAENGIKSYPDLMAVYFNALQNDYDAEDIRKFSYVVRNLQSYDLDNN